MFSPYWEDDIFSWCPEAQLVVRAVRVAVRAQGCVTFPFQLLSEMLSKVCRKLINHFSYLLILYARWSSGVRYPGLSSNP